MKKFAILSMLLSFCLTFLQGQDKIVISDPNNLLNDSAIRLLSDNLSRNNLEYTTMMDFRVRCEYYMGNLGVKDDEAFITLMDCESKEVGTKSLGTGFLTAGDQEKAILLSFAINDIAKNPGRYISQIPSDKPAPVRRIIAEEEIVPTAQVAPKNEHYSRYFFAPSAYNLEKGELYLNTIYFLVYDFQYGISDNFTFGMGTTIAGFPFYITPKFSFPAGEKSTIGIGDMLILGTWGSDFIGNLAYGVYTYGTHEKNISLGTGLLSTNESDITKSDNSLVLNFSGLAKASDYVYFVTENYGFSVNTSQDAYYNYYNSTTGEYIYDTDTFAQRQTLLYGLAGLRFINKTRDVISWQFGLTYLITFFGDIPEKYTYGNWETYTEKDGSNLVVFPTVSYTRKFGKKF